MSAIKDGRVPILLDKPRHILFSLNVIDEVEDRLGDIQKLEEVFQGVGRFKHIKWLFTLLLNEGADDGEEPLTENQVGKLLHGGNLQEVISLIFKAFALGKKGNTDPPPEASEAEEDYDEDDDETGNAQAGGAE